MWLIELNTMASYKTKHIKIKQLSIILFVNFLKKRKRNWLVIGVKQTFEKITNRKIVIKMVKIVNFMEGCGF